MYSLANTPLRSPSSPSPPPPPVYQLGKQLPVPPLKPRSKIRQLAIIVFASLMMLCVLAGLLNRPGERHDSIAVPLATATERVASEPTATTEPSLTPTGIPAESAAYFRAIGRPVGDIANSLGELSKLLQAADVANEEWRINTAVQIAIIKNGHRQLVEMSDVPSDVAYIHDALLDATSDCDRSMDHLVQGLDQFDASEIQRANELMSSCAEKIGTTNDLVAEYKARHE